MELENNLKINCKTENQAINIQKVLNTEMKNSERFSSKIERIKNIVVINITAKDAVILRSVINSYLRILSMTEKIDNMEER
ncbi:MAG: KEOPS complex subunit Pcc1 [Candidatus Micrarchaeia archaeon]|jgi:tRNA threonylcarbamoyladenosine modification (KEOPS) complex  Pcc1 subunit